MKNDILIRDVAVEADPTSLGLVYKNRVQTKTSSATLSTSGTGVMTFSNLVVGKVYKITLSVRRASRTANDGEAYIYATHNGSNVFGAYGAGIASTGGTTETVEVVGEATANRIFTATATTLSVDYIVASGNIFGCRATLEELNNYEVTTAFT